MGKTWGNLAKIRGVVFFRLSPHEQKAFGGMVSKGLPNMYRRFKEEVLWVTAPLMSSYLLINWANDYNFKLSCKNPADYENDV